MYASDSARMSVQELSSLFRGFMQSERVRRPAGDVDGNGNGGDDGGLGVDFSQQRNTRGAFEGSHRADAPDSPSSPGSPDYDSLDSPDSGGDSPRDSSKKHHHKHKHHKHKHHKTTGKEGEKNWGEWDKWASGVGTALDHRIDPSILDTTQYTDKEWAEWNAAQSAVGSSVAGSSRRPSGAISPHSASLDPGLASSWHKNNKKKHRHKHASQPKAADLDGEHEADAKSAALGLLGAGEPADAGTVDSRATRQPSSATELSAEADALRKTIEERHRHKDGEHSADSALSPGVSPGDDRHSSKDKHRHHHGHGDDGDNANNANNEDADGGKEHKHKKHKHHSSNSASDEGQKDAGAGEAGDGSEFPPGSKVRIMNIAAKPELNGQTGVVREYLKPKAKYRVKMDSDA